MPQDVTNPGADHATDHGAKQGTDTATDIPSAEQLSRQALHFLRRFGLASAVWTLLLGIAAPSALSQRWLWIGVGIAVAWAIGSQWVADVRWWWIGWLAVTVVLEWTGPLAGTDGWSVTGGSMLMVLLGVVLGGRGLQVLAATLVLIIVGAVRPWIGHGWPESRTINTVMFVAFGALAITWLVSGIERVVRDRDRLQAQLLQARTATARATERAEAGARLHDTVLQHLTAVTRADDLDAARRHAGRASNQLRQFLRTDGTGTRSLRTMVQEAATGAADGVEISVSVAGDRTADDADHLLVDAVAEAVRNAARHGQPPIRLHAELPRGRTAPTRVWIVDQGPGFDPDEVAEDRLGVRESIVGRLQRAGGTATLEVGDTTEWELVLPATRQ